MEGERKYCDCHLKLASDVVDTKETVKDKLSVGMFKWVLGILISVLIAATIYNGRAQGKVYDTVTSIDKRLAVVEALIKGDK